MPRYLGKRFDYMLAMLLKGFGASLEDAVIKMQPAEASSLLALCGRAGQTIDLDLQVVVGRMSRNSYRLSAMAKQLKVCSGQHHSFLDHRDQLRYWLAGRKAMPNSSAHAMSSDATRFKKDICAGLLCNIQTQKYAWAPPMVPGNIENFFPPCQIHLELLRVSSVPLAEVLFLLLRSRCCTYEKYVCLQTPRLFFKTCTLLRSSVVTSENNLVIPFFRGTSWARVGLLPCLHRGFVNLLELHSGSFSWIVMLELHATRCLRIRQPEARMSGRRRKQRRRPSGGRMRRPFCNRACWRLRFDILE